MSSFFELSDLGSILAPPLSLKLKNKNFRLQFFSEKKYFFLQVFFTLLASHSFNYSKKIMNEPE